jgi:hypothetical protein
MQRYSRDKSLQIGESYIFPVLGAPDQPGTVTGKGTTSDGVSYVVAQFADEERKYVTIE